MAPRRLSIPADFDAGTKECAWCHVIRPITDFHKNIACRDGLNNACKICTKPVSDQYYQDHKDERIAYATEWNQNHRELRTQYNEKWLAANIDEQRARRSIASKERYWSDPEYWRQYYGDSVFKNNLLRNFQLTVEQYVEMLVAQDFGCAICHKECKSVRRLAVDHDHNCCPETPTCGKCVRGLLCNKCNGGIGFLDDDIDKMVTAIAYIEFHRNKDMVAL